MAGAAGGFLTRSFEAMLKDSSSKKHGALQKAIQAYLDCTKEANQQAPSKKSETPTFLSTKGIAAGNEVSEEGSHPDAQQTGSTSKEGEVAILESAVIGTSVTTALASAGHTMEGAQCELVLQPLRLAFETKNTKLVEYALDCLHKLIAYDHLEGDPGLEAGKNSTLFTDILNMVCSCVDNSSSDSTVLQVLKVLLTAVASTKFRVHREPLLGVIRVCYNIALNSKSPISQATSKAMLTQIISIIFQRIESDQAVSSSSLSSFNPSNTNSVSNNEEERAMDDQDEKKIPLGDALPINQGKEKSHASIEELQNLAGAADIKGLEAILDKVVNLEDAKQISRGTELESMGVEEHDAMLLFRTLCKMGMEENDDVTTKARNLSLELLQGLLEGVSHSCTQNFYFIDSVKAYLSYTLLRASVASSSAAFQYAAGIFVVLLSRFRESIKGEIAVFFPLIVLRPLDSSDSPLSQRTAVLRILEKVCKDSQMLADIFVNCDCDLEAPNLFGQMVDALSRIAQGVVHTDPSSVVASQIASVKGASLLCLVSVLKSLVDWEKLRQESAEPDCRNLSVEDKVVVKESIATTEDAEKEEGGPGQFEKDNAHKFKMESAISEFNCNPARGVELLLTNSLVEKSVASIAKFLKDTSTLDKVMIGEYLGEDDEFPLAVMHAYVDSMKFSGLKFDLAIREFLQGFQLPREAQKIDRIMEKFSERYCADNPGLFKNADTAYVLVYAVIMLNTDAHNPMVWPKISKSDFVHMNSVSHGEEGAPRELLEDIYDSVIKEEIKMKNDVSKSNTQRPDGDERGNLVSILNLALPRIKSAIDSKAESEQIIKTNQALFRKQGVKRHIFHTAEQIELVRPMLEAVGWPLLAAFSVIMEEGADKAVVILCMEGFKFGIHITNKLGMDTLRYAFLTSLIRFNLLHAPKEMRSKNVEALRTLLAICDTETESLQDTWNAVLECVSRLDYITSSPSISATVMLGSNQISRESVVQSLRELSGKPVEQVFVNSVKLPSDSIVEFFTALCAVSTEELKQTPARVFSLQNIVKISYYNMARIHLVWARIWSVLSHHFISAGSHPDQKISMCAVDSLRQLSMKYLERVELTNFTFQNDILNPFVILMQNSRSEATRGMIVDCIVQMIKSRVGSIRSGWKSVFLIFTAASDDDLEPIIDSAFENVEQVILEHFEQVASDCFMDCVNCLIGFASNKTSSRISLKAIALLRICEDRLAEGLIPGGALKPVDIDPKFDSTEQYWFPMLAGLSDLCLDSRGEVRNCALEVLFDLLNERGHKFSSGFWENIFHHVLFPIFDHIRHVERDSFVSSGNEWFRDTTVHSLQLVCDLFNAFYKEVSFMLAPLLSLLLDCAKKVDQSVVSLSLGALVHLIKVGGHHFSESDWDILLNSIRDACYTTQPLELLSCLGYVNLKGQPMVASDAYANRSDSPSSKDSHFDNKGNDGEIYEGEICPVTNDNMEMNPQLILEENGGRMIKVAEPESLQRSQTIGQRLMDNILLRSFTSKPKPRSEDVIASSSSLKIADVIEPSDNDEDEEYPLLETVRGKCITQLLLLGVLDRIQGKYWGSLSAPQKIAIMEVLLSVLEFASSFNSYSNLRMQMHQMPSDRPPLNLLRQEFIGTSIYMDILQKTTAEHDISESKHTDSAEAIINVSSSNNETTNMELKLKLVAEEKLVSFCEQILKEASELHSSMGEAANIGVHRVLELRAPVIVKVLKGMCQMNKQIFKKHLSEFYPIIIKLISCERKDIREALADLFSTQLTPLLQ